MAKAVKTTVKSVVVKGITNGWTMDKILKAVAKKCPNSVADESHVKFYSAQLKRDGDITPEQHAKYIARRTVAKEKTVKKEKPSKKKSAVKEKRVKKVAKEKKVTKKPAKEKKVKEKKERKRSKKSKKD